MSNKLIFHLPGNEALARSLSIQLKYAVGKTTVRRFPDQESYVRVEEDVKDKEAIVVCTLNEPDTKLLPLYFLCSALKEFGARHITLVAPYLAYMRQDKRFHTGEAITSAMFAKLVSGFADRLITIDPHLHRRSSLGEIYSIPAQVLHAAPLISAWVKEKITNAVLIGPDEESEQWVSEVAKEAGVPYLVFTKERKGDKEVVIKLPDTSACQHHRPVLVDDIISTAHTMAESVVKLKKEGFNSPVCIGVHGILAGRAEELLTQAGAEIVTTNSIPSAYSQIDISGILAGVL